MRQAGGARARVYRASGRAGREALRAGGSELVRAPSRRGGSRDGNAVRCDATQRAQKSPCAWCRLVPACSTWTAATSLVARSASGAATTTRSCIVVTSAVIARSVSLSRMCSDAREHSMALQNSRVRQEVPGLLGCKTDARVARAPTNDALSVTAHSFSVAPASCDPLSRRHSAWASR
jgi:hypothetical protein